MATVKLRVPTLVRHIKIEDRPHYFVRPIFLQHPVATNRQFNGAVSRLQHEIKDYFKGFTLQRENLDGLLWFLFHPELRYEQYSFDFQISKQFVKGAVGAVTFELQGLTFVCLPGFNNYLFIAAADEGTGKINLREQVGKVAQQLLRQYKTMSDEFSPEDYFSEKREFITEVNVNIHVEHAPFKFQESSRNWFMAMFAEQTEFNGALEIEKVGTDLNSLFPAGLRRAYYLEEEVSRIYRIIFQEENTPLAIVGPEGVGRHTLLHEVIWRYQDSRAERERNSRGSRIWHVDPTRIIAGMSIVGMWEKRFEAIIRFLRQPEESERYSDKMMVDNPVALLRIGRSAQSNMTLADVLKSYLEKRQLQVILIATPEEWKVIQERDRRFSDQFQVFRMQEPPVETALRIVLQQRRRLELENDTVITIQGLGQLLTIHRNYFRNRPLPGSMMKLLTQLAIKYRSLRVDVPEVREEFRAYSGLEERIFDPSQSLDDAVLSEQIRQQLVGQPDAAQSLTDVIHLIKSRLADRSKPISSFLFIGPTGVGKTQAAKVLCQYLMGSDEHLLRFDMNEFIDADAVQRLIGDYYQPEGLLTGKVRYRPFGILLLDEIEKAHEKVHDLLLQVLDDGRLTDSLGRTVDFSNVIVIMTSNIGAREIGAQLGYSRTPESEEAIYRKAVERHFRPEFVNRIDQIVIFNPLQLDHILRIARLQITELLQRDGFVRRTTILNISQEALEWVARRGFDVRMGGRALRRQIERDLTALSAEQLISTPSDHPIILDIYFQGGRLVPQITELQFVNPLERDPIPALPDEKRGQTFYRKLMQALDNIHERIRGIESRRGSPVVIIPNSGQGADWLYFQFKDRLADTYDRTQTIMLGFRDPFFSKPPAIPLRLKRGSSGIRRLETRAERENLRDRLFQEEALREISETYHFSSAQFDSIKSEFIDHYLDVGFTALFARGLTQGKAEKITLKFRSLITGLGGPEIDFLIDLYTRLLKEGLDLSIQVDKKKQQITVEGYSVSELLAGETGIHLFYIAHRNPLPIHLGICRNPEEGNGHLHYQVIRIYDGTSTLTDLRTGYSNDVNITVKELKFLLYAGIDARIREELLF